ncbi:serine/threonine-protein phosphatase [candidate division KSB1 bacterium]|nr:serine/threonine-protein phosphatase [candidate division KSB1 bacterium]
MKTPKFVKRLKRAYDLLTSDLNFTEIEHLFKNETPGIFEFYTRESQKSGKKRKGIIRFFSLVKNLFVAFVLKLTPARRIIYIIGLYFFVSGLISANTLHCILGFLVINTILAFELADKLVAKDELEVARNIQTSLMPKSAPRHSLYDIAFFTQTAREVGGDFCYFISHGQPDDPLVVIIGDISGKGMGAAIHMVQVHTILQTLQHQGDIKQLLIELNERLVMILPANVFFTSNFIELDPNGYINICRAGHMPVLHYSVKTQKCKRLTPAGIGIGLTDNNQFHETLEKKNIKPEKGDIFILYTDGLVETRNKNNVEFGEDRLEELFCRYAGISANEIKDEILKTITRFRGSAIPHDDLTLVVFKYMGR